MFAKEADINQYIGLKVQLGNKIGKIESSFGQGSKFKVYFQDGITQDDLKESNSMIENTNNNNNNNNSGFF